MNLNKRIGIVTAVLACGIGGGCDSNDDGTLEQDWTIEGSTNPNACTVAGAAQMRVILVGSNGIAEATNFAPCASFRTTQTLEEDTYSGTATFVDVNGVAVSQTKILPLFTIIEGQTTFRTIDFSAGDFLAR